MCICIGFPIITVVRFHEVGPVYETKPYDLVKNDSLFSVDLSSSDSASNARKMDSSSALESSDVLLSNALLEIDIDPVLAQLEYETLSKKSRYFQKVNNWIIFQSLLNSLL